MRRIHRGISPLDVLATAQVSIALDRALDELRCPHCGAVGCRIAETLPDGKRAVRCKTCKRPMHEEKKMTISETQLAVFQVARDKGWWDDCAVMIKPQEAIPGLDVNEPYPDRSGSLVREKVEALIPEKLCLIHSEIVEADDERGGELVTTFEASGKPVGFPTEIADVVIRALDLAGAMEASIEAALSTIDEPYGRLGRAVDGTSKPDREMSDDEELLFLHAITSRALECYRKNEIAAIEVTVGRPGQIATRYVTGVVGELARLVMHCFRFAKKKGIDLDHEIAQKHAFNKKRSFKHGNKRC